MRSCFLRVPLIALLLLGSFSAMATNTIFNNYKSVYPNNPLSTSLSCNLCHVGSNRDKTNLTLYGLDLKAKKNSTSLSWTASIQAIATTDSDHDGFSNSVEILAGFNPSDATKHPVRNAAGDEWSLYE